MWEIRAEMRDGKIVIDQTVVEEVMRMAQDEIDATGRGGIAVVRQPLRVNVYIDYTLEPGDVREFETLEEYQHWLVDKIGETDG